MKSLKSNLFKKFEDEKLTKEAQSLIEGGLAGPGSNSTGDHDCTNRGGKSDCGDVEGGTDAMLDVDPTASGDDGCIAAPIGGGGYVTASVSYQS